MSEGAPASADALIDHHGLLKAYFTRRLNGQQDAEDYVHEVYSRVLASVTTHHEVRSWKALLMQVAKSVMIDQVRRDRARQRDVHLPFEEECLVGSVQDNLADPELAVSQRQQLRSAQLVLEQLDPVCRQAFLLARIEGHCHRDIARRLGISTQMVGRHIQQALYALTRARLDQANPK